VVKKAAAAPVAPAPAVAAEVAANHGSTEDPVAVVIKAVQKLQQLQHLQQIQHLQQLQQMDNIKWL
jgi:3-oxoacyl-ACP reductase-like protein